MPATLSKEYSIETVLVSIFKMFKRSFLTLEWLFLDIGLNSNYVLWWNQKIYVVYLWVRRKEIIVNYLKTIA